MPAQCRVAAQIADYDAPCSRLQEAKEKGPREKLLYVPCIVPDHSRPDYLATVDADPESSNYSKV